MFVWDLRVQRTQEKTFCKGTVGDGRSEREREEERRKPRLRGPSGSAFWGRNHLVSREGTPGPLPHDTLLGRDGDRTEVVEEGRPGGTGDYADPCAPPIHLRMDPSWSVPVSRVDL